MEILLLVLSFVLGVFLAVLILYSRFRYYTPPQLLSEKYVLKELITDLQSRFKTLEKDVEGKNLTIIELSKELSSFEQINANLEEKLSTQKEELLNLQTRFQTEFENIANRLLEEKSVRFTQQNQVQLGNLLNPLREKIKEFEEGMERKFLDETRERVSLKTEIEHLRNLNQQLSQDAHNLVSALRGDSKIQGDWGEMQLEMLLEKAGLMRGVHFQMQMSYSDQNGQQKRPDLIIQMPDNKQLIIDSKVSLTAYEQYFNQSDPLSKKRFLNAHFESLKNHFKSLSEKNYSGLYQVNAPDYVIMFIPIENALSIALQEDSRLFTDALDKNVLIVTPTTLLATMRTVSFIWKQENQKRNVLEIARQSGMLYDKFVAFIEDLKEIGQRLDMAQNAYSDAMNKLNDSKKYGDTLVGRAEKIRELGAKATKTLPKELLEVVTKESL